MIRRVRILLLLIAGFSIACSAFQTKIGTCPTGSTGDHPNCKCDKAYYSEKLNSCIKCPTDAKGVYPDCKCVDANLTFSAYINQCYLACRNNSFGISPDCQCDDGYYYVEKDKTCKSNVGRLCPNGSTGIGPNCICKLKDKKFDSSSWSCADGDVLIDLIGPIGEKKECPNKEDKYPQCGVTISPKCLASCVG